ncbi:MAG: DEAD/DEAH box helicase [Candidatus Microsaccharimonas sp.]
MAYQNSSSSNRTRSARPSGNRPGVRSFRPGKSGGRSGGGGKQRRGAYIHPSKFINRAVAKVDEVVYESTHQFTDFNFNPRLQRNIDHKGYVNPSAIQDQAIPFVLEGRDVIGLANTGTGKTAAFVLPIIERLVANPELNSVLIVAPTRELADQIDEQFRAFAYDMKFFSALVVGGSNIDRQIRQIKRGPHVIIGTPGRLRDLMKRKVLRLNYIRTLVLDEADRMLDMGFINDIKEIVNETPEDRQTLFFSATITPEIQNLVQGFLRNPETISVRTADTSESVDQDVVETNGKEHKLETLINLLTNEEFEKVLVFGETKFGVQRLSDHLDQSGVASTAIHGNKSQSQRQRALRSFKENKVRVLVATDVAARGLDIPNVSHVINFDQPQTYEDYVHRIGRTGRGGATGKALTFIERR